MAVSIGQLALEQGFITPAQLEAALRIQEQVQLVGLNETIEEILLKKGWLNHEQVAALHAKVGEGVQQLIPGYEVLEKIGTGGMGSVYKARRLQDQRIVAVKTLLPGSASQEGSVDRFLRESKLLMQLRHPNLIAALDAGFQKGVYYYVMELVDGTGLADLLQRRGRLPWKEAAGIVRQVAQGLQCAAGAGIVHRDIKPGNILLAADGTAKVSDLGIAKITGPANLSASLTTTGDAIVGTPQYMSPEQAQGQSDIDPRSDIYSLGLTLFAAITGAPPFPADAPLQVLQRRLAENVPIDELRPYGVPEGLLTIVKKMCARQRAERYENWDEVIRDLTEVEAGRRIEHHAVEVSADPSAPILGRLAVSNGFITNDQLKAAMLAQEKQMKAGNRKLLGNILVEEGFLRSAELKKLLGLQSFHERHSADRTLGDLIVQNGIAPAFAVQEALSEQKEMFGKEGFSLPIDQILYRKGIINEQQRRAILRLTRMATSKREMTEHMVGVRECPNCVEAIPMNAAQCPRCRYVLESTPDERRCPACSTVQLQPGDVCSRCGCNMVTGRRASPSTRLVACLECGKLAPSTQSHCGGCGTPLKGSAAGNVLRRTSRTVRRVASHLFSLAIPLGLVAAAIFIWMNYDVRGFYKSWFGGKEGAASLAGEKFLDACIHKDYVGATKMFHNRPVGTPLECMQEVRQYQQRTFGVPLGPYRLIHYEVKQIQVRGEVANVYLQLSFVHEDRPAETFDTRSTMYLTDASGEWKVLSTQ